MNQSPASVDVSLVTSSQIKPDPPQTDVVFFFARCEELLTFFSPLHPAPPAGEVVKVVSCRYQTAQ